MTTSTLTVRCPVMFKGHLDGQTIEETGKQRNHTLVEHDVNVIHSETWFNVTGLGGSNFFGGSGVGSYHNDSYIYQATNADWDNRTVRLVWTETGPDASSGDERPERSPIEQDPTFKLRSFREHLRRS